MGSKSFVNMSNGTIIRVPSSSAKNTHNDDLVQTPIDEKTSEIESPLPIYQGDNKMAEVDTNMLASQHSDIRREAAEHRASLLLENMKGFDRVNADVLRGTAETRGDVKDARYDLGSRIGDAKDQVTDQSTAYFIANMSATNEAARDLATLRTIQEAGIASIRAENALNAERLATAGALEAAKNQAANALGQAQLTREIFMDGEKTRGLINDLKYHDLNRALVERNTELVEERHSRRHYRDRADQFQSQGQWAALQSQIQAFQSQLQTATQGTVNFGTMSGDAGRNTSTNNVA